MDEQSEPVDLRALSEEERRVIEQVIAIGMLVEFGFAAADRRVRGKRGLLVTA